MVVMLHYKHSEFDDDESEIGKTKVIVGKNIFGGTGERNEIMHSLIMNKNGKTNAIRVNLPANTSIILKKVKDQKIKR